MEMLYYPNWGLTVLKKFFTYTLYSFFKNIPKQDGVYDVVVVQLD